ncbi:phosphatase PAP2 family protein [Candidatus Woesearchaeota archaeon]|nr:phosphatase PAP2 family protein [Candidatus Woesearchaeota archaeon]
MRASTSRIISAVSLLGTPAFYLPIIAIAFISSRPLAYRLIAAAILAEAACASIKLVYRKERPTPQSRRNIIEHIDAGSFPSTHTARISAVTSALTAIHPSLEAVAISIVLASLVAWSRIRLKKHFIPDVMAGAAIGIIIGIIAAKV